MPHRCIFRQKGLACETDDDEAALKAVNACIMESMNHPALVGKWLDAKATSKGKPYTVTYSKESVEGRQARPSIAAALLQEVQPTPPPQPTSSTRIRTADDGSRVDEVLLGPTDSEKEDDDGGAADDEYDEVQFTSAEMASMTVELGATAKAAPAPSLPSRRAQFRSTGPSSIPRPSQPLGGHRAPGYYDWVADWTGELAGKT